LISTLEAIVAARAQGPIESLARDILQAPTARVIETWAAQRFTVAAALTNAQAAVLPEFSFGAEALRCVDISTGIAVSGPVS
jgi:hypothetical protein